MRRSTFQTGSGRPCSRTIRYRRCSASALPSATSESTASTTCGRLSSRARFSSRTTAAGSQCPPRTASVRSRRTASASVSSATASASARATGATGTPATSSATGSAAVRTMRAHPVVRSRRSRGTSTSTTSRDCSGGAAEKPCRANPASPVIIASAYAGTGGCSPPGWTGTAAVTPGTVPDERSRAA